MSKYWHRRNKVHKIIELEDVLQFIIYVELCIIIVEEIIIIIVDCGGITR